MDTVSTVWGGVSDLEIRFEDICLCSSRCVSTGLTVGNGLYEMNKNTKPIALRVAELLLFLFALGMLIPPVPSNNNTVYRLAPTLFIGGSAFALSLLLATCRRGEHWLAATIKLLFYFLCSVCFNGNIIGKIPTLFKFFHNFNDSSLVHHRFTSGEC